MPEIPENVEKTEKTEKSEQIGKTEELEKTEKPEQIEKAEELEKTAESEKSEALEETEKSPLQIPGIEQIEAELRKEQYKHDYIRVLKSTAFTLLVVAAAAVIIAVLICPVIQIVGESMSDTLQDGDIVVAINDSKYATGNVVAFYYNNNILIKRVIATAGSWVDIDRDGNVSVNGEPLDEPYVTDKAIGECNITLPYQVPDDRIFVMGDHRETSVDSRNTAVGCISSDLVVGRILFRIWPLSGLGSIS